MLFRRHTLAPCASTGVETSMAEKKSCNKSPLLISGFDTDLAIARPYSTTDVVLKRRHNVR